MRRRDLMAMAGLAMGIAPAARAAAKPVVLELFTSQGCSSCPPADALLGELARRPDIVALAWHVDYWDNLGWRDPFASRLSTERQKAYARQLGNTVFTPALVVNGADVVVGSQRSAVEQAIAKAASLAVPVAISRSQDGLTAEIGGSEIGPAGGPLRALRIVYDPEHATDVRAGENQGEQLREYRIVREAAVLGEWEGGPRRFTVAPAPAGQGLVVLVQSAGLRVVGVAQQPL